MAPKCKLCVQCFLGTNGQQARVSCKLCNFVFFALDEKADLDCVAEIVQRRRPELRLFKRTDVNATSFSTTSAATDSDLDDWEEIIPEPQKASDRTKSLVSRVKQLENEMVASRRKYNDDAADR